MLNEYLSTTDADVFTIRYNLIDAVEVHRAHSGRAVFALAMFLTRNYTFDHSSQSDGVVVGIEEYADGRQSISSCSSRLLVVALNRLRQTVVNHKSYIRLVDAHAEG